LYPAERRAGTSEQLEIQELKELIPGLEDERSELEMLEARQRMKQEVKISATLKGAKQGTLPPPPLPPTPITLSPTPIKLSPL
jgi:hypothetical protein